MICKGCGGVLGRDCFNPQECEWIAAHEQMTESPQFKQLEHDNAQLLSELERYKSIMKDFKNHIMNAYYQGDTDGWSELRDCAKAREYKNSQDYYERTFGK